MERLTQWKNGIICKNDDLMPFDMWEISVIKKLCAYEDAEEHYLLAHVTRCKDCRYWERDSHSGICDRYCVRSDKYWFCAGGERKEV